LPVVTAVPNNYSELFSLYRPYVEKMVRKWGVSDQYEVEDIASLILEKFIERDMLAEFDSERGVLFSTFLGGFIGAYVRYLKDKNALDRYREGQSHDVVVGEGESTTVYDLVAPKHYDDTTQIEYLDFVRRMRAHLAALPAKKNDTMPAVAVFEQLVLQEYEDGKINVSEIARHFDVHLNTAKKWMKRIKDEIALVTGR
jgi:DNA-directed RNA polymerase specialized sigma24 family protein